MEVTGKVNNRVQSAPKWRSPSAILAIFKIASCDKDASKVRTVAVRKIEGHGMLRSLALR